MKILITCTYKCIILMLFIYVNDKLMKILST